MLHKKAHSDQKMSIEALNMPNSWAWSLYNTSRVKVASLDKTKKTDLGGFDLKAAIEEHPDNLFVKVFAIKANEVNDNGDCFSEAELKKAAKTFIGVPVFVNHQNDNVENARGKVVHAWYEDSAKGIYCINMVDRAAYPRLARGIEEKYIIGTSMGAQVGYSICSICHNKAHVAEDFCSHIKNGKNRKISGKHECKYHESSCKPEDDCPLDGKKKSESKELIHKEAKVYEWNYDIKFIEDSFVVNPACHDCLVCDILNLDQLQSKVSEKITELKKVAFVINESVSKMKEGSLEKTAGAAELQALTQAMNLMEHVARSMMAQKQQVQMDYVSDLVEQLAKVQSLTDELVEMGYAQLPSPSEHQIALGNIMSAPMAGQSQQVMDPNQMQGQSQQQQQPMQTMSQPGQPSSSSLGEIGNITRPTFSSYDEELKKEFTKQAENTTSQLESISSALQNSYDALVRRRDEVADSKNVAEYSNGNLKITVASTEDGSTVVGKWKDNKLVSWASSEEFGDEVKGLITSNPQEAAKAILSQYQKESGITMSQNTKIAAGNASQQDVTTQKQLDNAGPLHPREDKAPTVTTQAQLGGEGELKAVNDTTSTSNQLRQDDIREVITQAQLDSIKDGYVVRWGEYPEVITEAQWTEMSRRVSNTLGSDYTEQITQAQLQSLQDSHKWTDPGVITQKQLDDQKSVSPEGKSDSSRWASSAKQLIKSATSAVVDAIANYSLTPKEISAAINQITNSPQASIKASYLTLINAAPAKIIARTAERQRKAYFAKTVNATENLKNVDALIASMADNIGYLKAEDFLDAVRFIATDKKAFASAENNAQIKIASRSEDSSEIVDKDSLFRQAFAELDRPEDGLYKICGTLTEDVKTDPANKAEFMKSLLSFAKQNIDTPFVISNVNLDKEAGVFEIECKEERVCSENEKKLFASAVSSNFKIADKKCPMGENGDSCEDDEENPVKKASRSKNRSELIKQAQMMGGQMGGGMGGGGAQGGMGATMPGADAGGGGAPPMENLGGQPGELGGEDMMGGEEDDDMQAKPPGTICGICGSSNVDVLDGKTKCNNCGTEATWKLNVEYSKVPGVLDNGDEGGEGGEDGGMDGMGMGEEEGGGEGFALPDSGQPQESAPVAAMVQIRPEMIKKATEDFKAKGLKWSLGAISPYTGSTSVMKVDNNKFVCLDTGNSYEVHVAGVEGKGKKAIFAEWRFDAKPLTPDCPGCRRTKNAFAKALKAHGLSEDVFDSMELADKGKTILAMQSKGLFNTVKTASKNPSVLAQLKKTAGFGSKFPIETCRAKIARKFGENALALSGPCEGENLADCVCKKLSTAGVYSNSIAIKVAKVWSQSDQMVECVEDYVRGGLAMKKACFVCDQIKTKYAQFEDHLTEELGSPEAAPETGHPMDQGGPVGADSSMSGDFGDVDPFAGDQGSLDSHQGAEGGMAGAELGGGAHGGMGGTITVELPLEVLEQFDQAIDVAKGENPAGEAHHNLPMGDIGGAEAVVELPGQAVEQLDQAAGSALDTAVDVTKDMGGALDGAASAVEQAIGENPGSVEGDPSASDPSTDPVSDSGETEVGHSDGGDLGGESSEESSEGDSSDESSDHKEHHGEENSEEKEDSKPDFLNKESDPDKFAGEHAMAQAESATRSFKKGKISSTGEINLDLSSVMKVLANQKKQASEVKVKLVQDDKDIGKIKDGGTMGNEEKFDAAEPEVFTGSATMGGEAEAGWSPVTEKPSFDSGGAEMGHEKEQGYTAEKQNEITKNHRPTSASSKSRVSSLADRLINAANKTASDKKLEPHKPVHEDSDTEPYSANKDNPKSGNPRKPFEEGDKDIGKVEQGDASFMGHEKETLVNVPKEENSAPSIPAGGGTNPKYDNNKKNAPEKETAHKGTVIAKSNEESSAARKEAATRVAGRKLKAGMIDIGGLSAEIEKLARYEASDLNDLEVAIFGASKKGLDTVAKGSERALVISEKSNQRKSAEVELKDSIQSLFTMNKNNLLAQEDLTTEIRKNNNRR